MRAEVGHEQSDLLYSRSPDSEPKHRQGGMLYVGFAASNSSGRPAVVGRLLANTNGG